RLRYEKIFHLHAKFGSVIGIQSVLGVDEGGHPTRSLRLGDQVKSEGCLPGRFGTEDLDNAASWNATHAEGGVESERTGRNDRHRNPRLGGSEAHDRALAELLFN